MLHKKPTAFLAAAGLSAAAILVVRLHREAPVPPPPIAPPVNPYHASVAASGLVETLSENVAVGVPAAGVVATVHVKVWDVVRAGQPLFALDDRELAAQLAVHAAGAEVAAATLQRLADQLVRLKGVNDPRAVSQEEVRTRENDVAVARAQLGAARAQVDQTKVQLARLTVLAPRDGAILQVNVRPGEFAPTSPRSAPVILGDMEHLQVRAEIDEQNASRFQTGQSATAFLKGDTTRPIALQFVRVEPYVTPKVSLTGASSERVDTRVLQVIYAFDRPVDRPVYVGQQVDLYVKTNLAPSGVQLAGAAPSRAGKGQL